MSFQYKCVLLVGATSGIGAALARKMLDAGTKVIAVGRRKERLDTLVKEYEDKGSSLAFAEVLDISQLSSIPSFVERVTKAHSEIDCVFLNSGVQRPIDFSKPDTVDLSLVGHEVTTNFTAYVHLTTAFLPHLQKQQGPTSLIYTSSGLAFAPLVANPIYCATKAALHHFLMALRQQLKDGGHERVKVVEIFPPAVQTELHGPGGENIGMPLDEFTQETWTGLIQGSDEIAVGMARQFYDGIEPTRQKFFKGMHEMMKQAESSK